MIRTVQLFRRSLAAGARGSIGTGGERSRVQWLNAKGRNRPTRNPEADRRTKSSPSPWAPARSIEAHSFPFPRSNLAAGCPPPKIPPTNAIHNFFFFFFTQPREWRPPGPQMPPSPARLYMPSPLRLPQDTELATRQAGGRAAMSAKNNHKQQQQRAVAQMVAAAMAIPCPTKPLLVAIPLALGFALGIVATLSLMGSTASSALPGAALELFFPSPPVNVSTEVRRRQPQAAPATSASSPPPVPVADAGINKHAALPVQRRQATPATGVSSPPSPPVADAGSNKRAALHVNASTDEEGERRPVVDDGDQLMALAAAAPRAARVAPGGAPKVAFLFLAKWDLPMAPLWERFFEGHRGLYSVYVHTDPAFNASAAAPDSGSAFHRRHIPSKVRTRVYIRAHHHHDRSRPLTLVRGPGFCWRYDYAEIMLFSKRKQLYYLLITREPRATKEVEDGWSLYTQDRWRHRFCIMASHSAFYSDFTALLCELLFFSPCRRQ